MQVGQSASISRSYSRADLEDFASLSGTAVPQSIPEPLIAALFSYLLGVELPGPGTNYLKQELRFLAPASSDTELTAKVEITRLRPRQAPGRSLGHLHGRQRRAGLRGPVAGQGKGYRRLIAFQPALWRCFRWLPGDLHAMLTGCPPRGCLRTP
jgi:3-hydroxybutyryl-CoA dehydratase